MFFSQEGTEKLTQSTSKVFTDAHLAMIKLVYLTTVCILHDKAQTVMCLEGIFQSLQIKKQKPQSRTSCFKPSQEEAGILTANGNMKYHNTHCGFSYILKRFERRGGKPQHRQCVAFIHHLDLKCGRSLSLQPTSKQGLTDLKKINNNN